LGGSRARKCDGHSYLKKVYTVGIIEIWLEPNLELILGRSFFDGTLDEILSLAAEDDEHPEQGEPDFL
jgi:hypothetical protein